MPAIISDELSELIKTYLKYERIAEHKKLIEELVESEDVQQLGRLIGKRLTFGTAGIRGSMGAGFGQMNDLVIIQTSQGLASYLLSLHPDTIQQRGVIIGFDGRHNSSRFSRLTALAFLQKGIKVYYSDTITPTPLIAFGVKKFGCIAGIVITASHNPKNDNGYKVYFSNGAQILSPHDGNIQKHIMMDSNQEPWPEAWQVELLEKSAEQELLSKNWQRLLVRVFEELSNSYFTYIQTIVNDKIFNESSGLRITYTSMHGVGHRFLSRALTEAGFKDAHPVKLQMDPDPEFSTVAFPNPEESGALNLAFEVAKETNSEIILAVDPDADRCSAAVYSSSKSQGRQLNGNEIGAILGWWIWHCYQELKPPENKKSPSDCYMISTAVSSKFLQRMAQVEGFNFVETLTGFKYMGNLADKLIKEDDKHVLFAFEEAIGYMCNSNIIDKDGISASVQVAQCAAYVKTNYNRTLEQQLDWLHCVYGYHFSVNSYYICSDPATIREIFTTLQKEYPKEFTTEFQVNRVRDLNCNYDSSTATKKAELPSSSSSYMVTFFINDNITFTMRTSGTEPKIKYYSEIVSSLPKLSETELNSNNFSSSAQLEAKQTTQEKLKRLVRLAIESCLKPDHYQLESAKM